MGTHMASDAVAGPRIPRRAFVSSKVRGDGMAPNGNGQFPEAVSSFLKVMTLARHLRTVIALNDKSEEDSPTQPSNSDGICIRISGDKTPKSTGAPRELNKHCLHSPTCLHLFSLLRFLLSTLTTLT